VRERVLVLAAAAIEHRVLSRAGVHGVWVRETEAAEAVRQIAQFEHENRGAARPAPAPAGARGFGWGAALLHAAILCFFHLFTIRPVDGPFVRHRGEAAARNILDGEWWRTVTALFLHADLVHLAGNVGFGGLFIGWLAHWIGAGSTFAVLILGGALGNFSTALVTDLEHRSIGASTAVFAAIGALAALAWRRRRRLGESRGRRWAPLFLGAFFVYFLGSEGVRTDLVAHACGFLSGILLGFALDLGGLARTPARPAVQQIGAGAGALVVAAAWLLALR